MKSHDELIEIILASDGGTCHAFGQTHCFNDPTWTGRRCGACTVWAERILRNVQTALLGSES